MVSRYIYDYKGVEIHCMRDHERTYKLDFLPYHYLLTSVGHSGWVKWHDVSTGTYVAGYQTGHGPCRVMKQNPHNAVLHLGHSNGVVSLWSPTAGKALVSMLCHNSPVTDVAVDRDGMYMATAGLDGLLKVSSHTTSIIFVLRGLKCKYNLVLLCLLLCLCCVLRACCPSAQSMSLSCRIVVNVLYY